MLHSIKNTSRQFLQLLAPIAAALKASESLHTINQKTPLQIQAEYVEIKCQLDARDEFYCRSYCLLNMFRAPLCPSSGALEYHTSGCCLLYLVLGFQVVGTVWS
jgi:hypothetical protein